jgi:hypothetical protein
MKRTDGYIVGWKAWYDVAGQPVGISHEQSTLEDLPEDGFQAMRISYAGGTSRFMSGSNTYFFAEHADGHLIFGQTDDTPSQVLLRYPHATVKRGRYVSDKMNAQIHRQLMEASDCCG